MTTKYKPWYKRSELSPRQGDRVDVMVEGKGDVIYTGKYCCSNNWEIKGPFLNDLFDSDIVCWRPSH